MHLTATPHDPPVAALRAGLRWSRLVAAAAIGVTVVAALLPLAPTATGAAVLAATAAGLLLGLPHGAVDHVLAARLTGWSTPVAAAAYAVVVAVAWLLLTTTGPVALVAVLALSLTHFGLGELEVTRETTGWAPSRPVALAVALAGTGALLLPLARSGDQLVDVATAMSPDLGTALDSTAVRAGLALVWVVAALVAVASAVRAGHRSVVLDVALVGALGLLVPPLAAFALWFGGWHGLRHCARLLAHEGRSAGWLHAGQPGRAVRSLAATAAWPTLAATAVLVVLLVLTARATDPTAALGGTLMLLLALTVPHMLVVLWLDRAGAPPPDRTARALTTSA